MSPIDLATPGLSARWWAVVLRGVFAIIFGVIALAEPGITLAALVITYGVYALADGLFSLVTLARGRRGLQPWWSLLLEGLLGIGAGVVSFVWPKLTLLVLVSIVAAWAIIRGGFLIAAAIRLRQEIKGEWLLALAGVLSVVLGVLIFMRPVSGAVAIAFVLGVYAIAFGVVLIGLGFRMKRWADRIMPTRRHEVPPPGVGTPRPV